MQTIGALRGRREHVEWSQIRSGHQGNASCVLPTARELILNVEACRSYHTREWNSGKDLTRCSVSDVLIGIHNTGYVSQTVSLLSGRVEDLGRSQTLLGHQDNPRWVLPTFRELMSTSEHGRPDSGADDGMSYHGGLSAGKHKASYTLAVW